MMLKNAPPTSFKSNIIFAAAILLSGLLLSSQNKLKFLSNAFFADITATISTNKTSVCVNETASIILEGTGGVAPYIFTYTINGVEETLETDVASSSISFEFKKSTPTDYVFVLTKVEDSDSTPKSEIISDQEITIKVNAPPVADFTFNNNEACSGETIQFTNNSSGTGALTYRWNFGDGNTSESSNPTNKFEAFGCDIKIFNIKLTVTDGNGCSAVKTKTITVKEKPDIRFRDQITGLDEFSNCGNTSTSDSNYEVTVGNISNSTCITSFFIDWGDGKTTSSAAFPAVHNYTDVGVYYMKIIAEGINGCKNEVSYIVKNVSNPAGGFTSPGNTSNLCSPTQELDFAITNWKKNSSDTKYKVDYGDGTIKSYGQSDLIAKGNTDEIEIPHFYNNGSCSEPNGEFIATLTVSNACGSTTFTIDNITVLEKSEVKFDVVEKSCVNKTIFFDNQSIIKDGVGCSKNVDFEWNFGDGTTVKRFSVDFALDENHTYLSAGTYKVDLIIKSFCITDTISKTICIQRELTPTFDVSLDKGCIPLNITTTNTTDDSNLCSTTPTYLWTVDYNADNCGNSANWEFTNSTDKNSENPSFVFKNPGKYTLTQSITTGCGTEITSKVISVKKPPTATINAISDACGSLTINPVATVKNCTDDTSGISYNWTFSGGSPTSSNTLDPGNITFNSPGIHTVTLEVTSECGVSNKATQSFEIFEIPILTNTDLTQEICSNQNTSEISFLTSNASTTYSWSANASANVSGYTPNGNSITIPVQTLVNNSNTVGTVTYTVIPKIGICEGDAIDFIITVNPAPKFTTQPTSSEICVNGTATTLEVAYQNGTGLGSYQWFSNSVDDTTSGTPIAGEINATYNPLTNTVGETYYYAEISFSSGGCTKITSNTAKVTVVEQLTMDAVAAPQTICVGGTANEFEVTYSGGTGNPTYQWFKNNSNTNSGGIAIPSANASTYTAPSFSTAGNFYFYATISLDGNGCTFATSAVFQVDVLTDPVIDTQAIGSQELCQNATPTDLTVVVSGGTTSTITYQWYKNTTNTTIGGVLIPGETASSFMPSTANVGSLYYYVVVSQSESGCSVVSNISLIKVNEAPIFTTQPTSSEICLNGTATTLEVAYTNGTGIPAYQWFSNINSPNPWGNRILGATNPTFDPPTNTVGELHYYAEISFTSGGCSKIVSAVATVNVVEQIVVNPVAAPQTICVGGTANEFEVTYSGGTGNPTYQWFKNNSNTNSGGIAIPSANASRYTAPSFSTVGNFYFYATISLDGNGCTFATSAIFQVDVLTDPVIDTQAIGSQELCQNATPTDLTVVVSGGTTSTITYQWYKNTTNTTIGGVLIPGETASSFMPSTANVGSLYYYVMVSQSESGCSVVSNISLVKVNEAPIFTTQPTSSEICVNGTATTLEVAYQNGTGLGSYQWFSNSVDDTTSGTPIAGATNATYNQLTNTVGKTYYYAEITFSSGGCTKITSNTAKVTVVEQLTMDAVAAPQTICVGGTANEFEVTYSGGTGNPTYQWFKNNSNTNSGGIAIPSANASTYTAPSFSTAGNFYFYATISLDGNGCTFATSAIFQVDVLTDPVIDTQAIGSQELCQNATPTDLTVVVSGGTTSTITYQWYKNTTNTTVGGVLIPGETASSFMPSTANVGSLYYYVVVSQSESGCSVVSDFSLVKVNEAPIFTTQPTSSEICLNGTATTLEVAYQNGTGLGSYQWFSNSVDSTTGTPIGGATNATYNPLTNTVGETYYYAEISFSSGGCEKIISNTARVIVNEIPAINSAEITIYSEETFNFDPKLVLGNTVPNGTKYTWSAPTFNPTGAIIGASSATNPQDQISQTLKNTGKTPIKVTYTITPATTKCTGISFILEVTVNPSINANAVIVNNNCFESNDGSIATNIDGGIPFSTGNPYLISWMGPNGFTATSATITNLEAGLYTLRIEDKNGISITEELRVTQPDALSITKNIEKNISCFQGNDGAIEVTISGGTNPTMYNWSTTDGSGIVPNSKNQHTLTAGTYVLEVVDENNCSTNETFLLTEPKGLEIKTIATQDILCFGAATGAISINVFGGTQTEVSPGIFDYTYNWSGPSGFLSSSKNITNLIAGTYTVTVTDNLGCTTNTDITLHETPEIIITYTKTDITCYGEENGAIDVHVTGGKEPYQISWSNFSNGFSLSNLSAATYIATITDANNCVKQVSIVITQPIFFIEPVVKPISCNGENDGAIDLNLTGGIAPIKVIWDDDASAGVQRNNLKPGTYKVRITDSDTYQCPIEHTFIFTNPPAIAVSSTVIDAIDCEIANSGSIDLTVSGGTKPFQFLWNTGETSEDIENISQGDYSVAIEDANGCSVTKQFSIFRQDPIEIEFTESLITDCETKTISKKVVAKTSGGFLPHTLRWSAGVSSGSNNEVMTTTQKGTYVLTVTDDNGCVQTKSILIDEIPTIGDPDFRYSAFAFTTYNLLSIEDPIQFTNLTTGNYTNISWNFGDGSPLSSEENPTHTYSTIGNYSVKLTVEYEAGCTYTIERNIEITIGYQLINPNAFTPNGDGYNETIRPIYIGFIEIEMNIYNTWGTLVYSEKGTSLKGWDGTINNTPAENGNYIMVVNGITFYKKNITTSTPVTLLK